ncbi:hypothetical protein WN944_018652 [Citrus x changshan-huyou]|uniref:Uncharacterized protein n=1 Tax=Citrus x changshan-huyou TaxID=2935761 RepID=A0AAP0LU22_9ROSI
MGDCERLRSLVILLKGLCLCFEGKTFDAVEVFDELSVSSLGTSGGAPLASPTLEIAVFLNAIPGKIHPKLCEKHYKPCNIASFWKANAMTVGTKWATDL